MASPNGDNVSGEPGDANNHDQVDAASLQYQNQMLVQKLEAQKAELHSLEDKFKELRDAQNSYEKTLISINSRWNQLVDDLTLLGVRTGLGSSFLHSLDHKELPADVLAACPPEEMFLCTLLQSGPTENNELKKHVQDAIKARCSTTIDLMNQLQKGFAALRARNDILESALQKELSSEDVAAALQENNEFLKEMADNMCEAVDVLEQKHKMFLKEIETNSESNLKESSSIKHLSVNLDESLAELEESRRKLIVLQIRKYGSTVVNSSAGHVANGSVLPRRENDKTMDLQELKDAVEEAKSLAASRLFELHETKEDNLVLLKQMEDFEAQLKDEKYVFSSKPYSILNDQVQQLNSELERCKNLVESLQNGRIQVTQRESKVNTEAESLYLLKQSTENYEDKIRQLESQTSNFIAEINDLEVQYEGIVQDTGKTDFKNEVHVMAAALSKEMEMMDNQLNRSKEAASEALSLQVEADSLRCLLASKITEHKILLDRCAEQEVEMKSLKELIDTLEKEKEELQIIVDLNGQECFDTRTITEIRDSEARARKQAEYLKSNLDEHSLELRVRAANESQTACQERLLATEAEIANLFEKLDASEREVMELQQKIRIKDAEGEAYISEIDTIGQAYEDMQKQNQHLLQQVSERDDFNMKLVSDGVKMKQAYALLVNEKSSMVKQLQEINGPVELSGVKAAQIEDQTKTYKDQAMKLSSDNIHLSVELEKATVELVHSEKELKWLQSVVGSSEKEYDQNQNKITELKQELDRERSERKKLEEEYEEVKNEVLELLSENEAAAIQKLEDEINQCKAVLKCNVCFKRPKEVVITKCFHLFCSQCIQRNLEIRHRKCPGCGTPFGQNDVREVKI